MQKSLSKSIRTHWRQMLSLLLVLLTVLGMLPTTALASDATPTYEPTGNFEVNIAGATGWNAYPMSLSVYDAETDGEQIAVVPAADENAPIAFVILEDNGGDRVKVGLAYDGSTLTSWTGGSVTKTGWVDKESIFVNLPDVLPSIAYNLTGREDQYSVRLGRYEHIVPCWYTLAEFLAESQKEAMSNGETLLVYDSGNQTADVNLAKGDPAELHDYEIDGAEYQKYEAWTDTNRSGRPDEWQKPFSTPANITRVYSVSPYTAFAEVVGRNSARRAPARAASNPTGGTGGLNPGSPGGQKPTSNTTAWYTDQERTFLRFTLVEFPEGVVTDLNSNSYNTWHVVGHPLNVVWGKGKIENWNADQCRSRITWFNSCAMQYNGAGSDAKSLMGGTVYSYDATAGENQRWVTTADEFQAESGITDQQKEQMFHCNSSSWTSGWKDGDYTSMWGTDPENVTPGNPYKVYKANDAFIYLLGRLSETGAAGSGWSKDEAIDKWSEYIHDKDGNLRTKYRIIVETGGVVVDPDGVRRAYTLREMMAYTQYNGEPNAKNNLIYDQSSTIKNMSRWMRQSKDNQFLEYPLDSSGTPTGEELHSTNGFREADSFVDSITSAAKIRDTIFSERRSYGLHIFSPFNFESTIIKEDRVTLDVTKSAEEGLDSGDGWSFTLTYTAGTPKGFTAKKNGTDCTSEVIDTGSGLTFKLKDGETIHFEFDADASFRCEVREDDTSNLTDVSGTGGTADKDVGKFTTDSTAAKVTFTNGNPPPPPPPPPPPDEPGGPDGPIVYKRDAMTNSGVGPATFKFASVVNGDYEFTTDTNGNLEPIQWWNPKDESEGRYIKPGEYAVTEIVPPPNYMPTTEVQQIKLELDDSGNGIPAGPLVFKNLAKVGLKIIKYDRESHQTMAGVSFEIFKDGNSIGRYETNPSGEILLTDIEPGTYRVVEVDTGDDVHILDTSWQEVELVAGGGVKELMFHNDKKPGMKLIKVDSSDPSKTIPGVKFSIRAIDGSYGPQEFTTDANGEIDLSKLPEGSYEVTEIECPGYVIDQAQRIIHLHPNDVAEFVFTNTKKPSLRLIKTSADGTPLDGVTFKITPIEDASHSIDRTTQNGGEILVDDLEPGVYSVVETATLPDHILDKTEYHVELTPGKTSEIRLKNDKRPWLVISKTDKDTGNPVPGVTFTLRGADGPTITTKPTGADGKVTINDLLPGVYTVIEQSVPEDYILDPTPQTVTLFPNREAQVEFQNHQRPTLKIVKVDIAGKHLTGAIFEVKTKAGVKIGDFPVNANGEIEIPKKHLAEGYYIITEIQAPEGYILDKTPHEVYLRPGKTTEVSIENEKKPGLTIYKVDSIVGDGVKGAKFKIYVAKDKNPNGTYQELNSNFYYTDANGIIHIDNLDTGWYKIVEVEPPDGFMLKEPSEIIQYIEHDTTVEVTFENIPKSALVIRKIDSDTGKPLANAWFRVRYLGGTSGSGGTIIGEYSTSSNGNIVITGLDAGTYVVEEISAPNGYVMDTAPQTAYISGKEQDCITLTFTNSKYGAVLIKKVDSVTGEPLSDIQFFITTSDGAVIGNSNGYFVTDSAGTILTPDIMPGTTLIVKETRTRPGYILDDVPQTVKIESNETKTLEFRNQPMGSLLIRKVCSVNPSVTLPNAEFKVAYSDGSLIGDSNGVYRSDENGEVRINGLIPGKSVVITETKAPAGFLIDTQSQTIVIQAGKTVTVTMKNQPKGKLIIQKRDSVTGDPLPGAQFRLTTAAGCEVGLDGVIGDATLTQNGIFTTDSNGEIRISNLAPGALILTEVKAPAGYVMDSPSTNVVIGPNGDTQTVIITNTKKGGLIIEKYDSVTKQPLRGATFKITAANGELVPDNEGLTSSNGLYTTDINGQIVLSKLLPGTYVVAEEKAPDHYRKDPTPQTVVVNAADTQTLRFYDDPLCTLTILKRDAVTKKPLAKAEFLVRDSEGKAIGPNNGRYITGSDGTVTVTGLEPNATIVVSETKAPSGYILDETPKNIVVRTGVANSLIFDNQPGTTLIIRKYVAGTENEPLSGVAFKVIDGSGAAVGPDDGVYYTDKAGEIVLSGIEPGTTVIAREIKTVDGFVLDGTPQTILIKGGEVQSLTFWNKRDCSLTILKQSTSKEPLTGAVFHVTDEDGGAIGTNNGRYTTDRNGLITITGLQPGQVIIVTEEQAPNGYVKDATPKTIKIKQDVANSLIFENAKTGSLIINKRSSADKKTPLEGVTFKITTSGGEFLPDEDGKISSNGLYYTDENGQVTIKSVVGTLVVTEVASINGYTISDANRTQTVEVKPDDSQTLYFYNDPLCSLTIKKVDSVTGKPVPNTEFAVKDANGNLIGKYTTGSDGTVTVSGLVSGTALVVTETKVPQGYVLNTTPQTVVVKNDTGNVLTSGVTTGSGSNGWSSGNDLTFENDPTTQLTIEKYLETEAGNQPLKGVTFLVTYSSGKVVGPDNGEYITGEDGRIVIKHLEPGTTVIAKEIKVPEGVLLDTAPKSIEIKVGDGQTLRFYNKKTGTIVIRKLDKTTKLPIAGAEFELTYAEGGYVDDANGHLSTKGRYTTNDAGEIRVPVVGTIIAKEVTPAPGYVIDTTTQVQTVTVNPADTQTLTYYNEPLCSLTLKKLDSVTGKPVPGTEFTLRDGDGNVLGKYTTGSDGTVTVNGLIPGSTVVVTETKVPNNYVLNPIPQTIIMKNGTGNALTSGVTNSSSSNGWSSGNDLTFENDPKTTLTIQKYLETETGNKPLKGVTFLVTDASSAVVGPNNGEYVTDENGRIVIKNLEPGTVITARETKVPEGVLLDTQPKSIEIKTGEGQTLQFVNKQAGTLVIRKLDKVSKTPIAGAEFEVTRAEGGYVDDANGHLSSKGRYTTNDIGEIRLTVTGTVVAKELTPAPGYVIDATTQIQTVKVNPADTQTLTFYNEPLCSLTLTKRDSVTGKPVPGTEFTLKDGDGNVIGRYTTGKDGTVTVTGLIPGSTVVAVETKVPSGYVLDATPKTIIVKNGTGNSIITGVTGGSTGTTTTPGSNTSGGGNNLDFENDPTVTLTIHKYIEGTANKPLAGVAFKVVDGSGAAVGSNGGVHYTNNAGEIVIDGLEPGMVITAQETKTVDGFVLDGTPQSVKIESGKAANLTFWNKRAGSLVIRKLDKQTGKPLANVEFEIMYAEGGFVDTANGHLSSKGLYTTDDHGEIHISGITGSVVVKETRPLSGYTIEPGRETQTVTVNPQETQTVTFYNIPSTSLVIEKYAEGTKEPLKGVTFLVTDSSGAFVGKTNGEYVTDENGRIEITGLTPGETITAKEIKGLDGYILDTTPKSIRITEGEAHTLKFYNQKAGGLIVNKVDAVTGAPLVGVKFKITYADGTNVDMDGGKVSSDGIYTTNSEGQIKILGITGTVIVTEIETVSGYLIDPNTKSQTVVVNANDTQTITFKNQPTKNLVIQKLVTGTKDQPLAGVEFLITDSSGAYVGPNNGIYKTDQYGRITLSDLKPGTVITAKETKTVDGYVLDSTPQSIEIKAGEGQTLTFYNAPVGGLELIKVSESDQSQRISGVTFEIRKMDGALVDTVTTGDNGRVHADLDAGDYYVVELKAADGFKIDSTPHYFSIQDGKTTTLTVTNAPFSGIIIHKINSVTGEGIYDVKFLLYDENKNPIGEYSTDNEGYIYIDDLTVQGKGKLFVRELEAAPGYELDKEYKTIYVQPGKTVEIEWKNVPITGQFQVYKYAAEYNEVTGTPAGSPLKGAVYEISEVRSGKVVDYITTDARGVAASKPLPLGRYKIVEVTAPPYWKLSGTSFDETLEYSGQIIKVSDYDKPSNLGVTITKRGNAEVLAGSQMRYDFTVANTSNVPLDNFFWHDRIPTDAATAMMLTTGTYSARLNYRILYKTSSGGDYQVLASNLTSTSSYAFNLNAIPTQAGEKVTDIYFDFGKVPVGFQSTTSSTLSVVVSGNVVNGYQLMNRADAGGKYQGAWQTAQGYWVTIVRKLDTPSTKLPKTGY